VVELPDFVLRTQACYLRSVNIMTMNHLKSKVHGCLRLSFLFHNFPPCRHWRLRPLLRLEEDWFKSQQGAFPSWTYSSTGNRQSSRLSHYSTLDYVYKMEEAVRYALYGQYLYVSKLIQLQVMSSTALPSDSTSLFSTH